MSASVRAAGKILRLVGLLCNLVGAVLSVIEVFA